MTPTKRSHEPPDSQDGEPTPSDKRQKHAGEAAAEENEEAEEEEKHQPPAASDVNDDEHDEEESEEEEEENQKTADSRRKSINKPGKPPEAGVIKSVYVENFMCHRKLSVELCRNVNFINGQNGSGKSAILAAIQICLGATAKRTNRARNLKELVRKDGGSVATHAKVRVTLLNGGDDAYQPDVYGKTITVERTISLGSGFNGFKLLDHKLVEKSRSKKDLDEMLDML